LSSALPLPITIKIRTGYLEKDTEKIVSIAKNCQQYGAEAIFVHGRTKDQEYSGAVDHAAIKKIKANVKIPVIASGNIFSALKAKEMIDLTHCDGVLIARGSFGNPWIFQQIKTYLRDGILLPDLPLSERLATLKKHLLYIEKYKMAPSKSKLGYARKIAIWYLYNFKYAAKTKEQAVRARSFQELYDMVEEILRSC
jgi:tRNA-dihydrouridine synthase B